MSAPITENATAQNFTALTEKITGICRKYDAAKDNSSGENFNIFKILHLNHSEVDVCRVLAELLSPTGAHGQGGELLLRFCRQVLHFEPKASEVKAARVHREFTLRNCP